MFKKVYLSIFVVVLVGVVWFGYGALNLKKNSVYYAQHTPHSEGVEPVLMEVVSNLDWSYTPDIDGISYNYDGYRNIYNNLNSKQEEEYFAYNFSGEYRYYDGESSIYIFDERFRLVRVFDGKNLKYSDGSVDISAVKRDIFRVVQPVIDVNLEPLINLQWIYDWVNKDRFN